MVFFRFMPGSGLLQIIRTPWSRPACGVHPWAWRISMRMEATQVLVYLCLLCMAVGEITAIWIFISFSIKWELSMPACYDERSLRWWGRTRSGVMSESWRPLLRPSLLPISLSKPATWVAFHMLHGSELTHANSAAWKVPSTSYSFLLPLGFDPFLFLWFWVVEVPQALLAGDDQKQLPWWAHGGGKKSGTLSILEIPVLLGGLCYLSDGFARVCTWCVCLLFESSHHCILMLSCFQFFSLSLAWPLSLVPFFLDFFPAWHFL